MQVEVQILLVLWIVESEGCILDCRSHWWYGYQKVSSEYLSVVASDVMYAGE